MRSRSEARSTSLASWPSIAMRPASGAWKRWMRPRIVDLPPPEGPTSAVVWSGSATRSRPRDHLAGRGDRRSARRSSRTRPRRDLQRRQARGRGVLQRRVEHLVNQRGADEAVLDVDGKAPEPLGRLIGEQQRAEERGEGADVGVLHRDPPGAVEDGEGDGEAGQAYRPAWSRARRRRRCGWRSARRCGWRRTCARASPISRLNERTMRAPSTVSPIVCTISVVPSKRALGELAHALEDAADQQRRDRQRAERAGRHRRDRVRTSRTRGRRPRRRRARSPG